MTTQVRQQDTDWNIDLATRAAVHRSGLVIRLQRSRPRPDNNWPAAVDISGLAALAGTPWAHKTDDLVTEGISLLGGDAA